MLKRRKFLKVCGGASVGAMLNISSFAALPAEWLNYNAERFKISRPRWQIYDNGSFDLIANEIILRNCRPSIDGQTVMPKNVFLGDSPKGKRIVYELPQGFLMLDLKTYGDSLSIGAEFTGFSEAPSWFYPISQARVYGGEYFFSQAFGAGDFSRLISLNAKNDLFDLPNKTARNWNFDSYLNFSFISNNETLVLGNFNQTEYLNRNTIYNRTHQSISESDVFEEQVFFESAIYLENISIKNEYIKLPELFIIAGNKPFETMQEFAWRVSEKSEARQGSVTNYSWTSAKHEECSFDILKQQVEYLENLSPKVSFQTLMLNEGYCELGDWLDPKINWPGGLDRVAREIFKEGYRAGVWIAPFVASSKSKLFKKNPDWFATDEKNQFIIEHENDNELVYALDLSNNNVLKYLERVFGSLRKMGFIYYELAYLSAGFKKIKQHRKHNNEATSFNIYREVLQVIRKEIGEGSLFVASNAPLAPLIGIADIYKFKALNLTFKNWTEIKELITESFLSHYYNNIYWQNFLGEISFRVKDNLLNAHEVQSFAMWTGLLGGGVGINQKIMDCSESELELIRFLEPSKRPANAYLPFWPLVNEIKVAVKVYKRQKAWGVLFLNDSDIEVVKFYKVQDLTGKNSAYVYSWKLNNDNDPGLSEEIRISLNAHQSKLFYFSEQENPPPENLTLGGHTSEN